MCFKLNQILFCFGLLICIAARGADGNGRPASKTSWTILRHDFHFPEKGVIVGCAVTNQGLRYCFLPPKGFMQDANAEEKKVTLTARDYSLILSFRIWEQPLLPAEWRQRAIMQYPGAEILNETHCYVADEKGKQYDLLRKTDKSAGLVTRVAFALFPGGTLEFQMTTAQDKFKKANMTFSKFLGNFEILSSTATPAMKTGP
jgi:hypothetical protein